MPDAAFELRGSSGREMIVPELSAFYSSGKPWGSTVLESKLRSEWCAGDDDGSICDSPTIRCLEVGQDPSRAEQKKEREGEYFDRARRNRHLRRENSGTCSDSGSLFIEIPAHQ